jgi:hypothetical protein
MSQPFTAFGGMQGGMQNFMSPVAQQKQPERFVEDLFDEAAFERAFDSAKRSSMEFKEDTKGKGQEVVQEPQFNMDFACTDPGDVMGDYDFDSARQNLAIQSQQQEQQQTDLNSRLLSTREPLQMTDLFMQQEQPLIGADAILAEDATLQSTEPQPEVEADELARTAGLLLDNLAHEHSAKFQNSSFLTLMRQLRDKEVRVEGEKIVDVGAPSTSTSSSLTPWISPQYGYYDDI